MRKQDNQAGDQVFFLINPVLKSNLNIADARPENCLAVLEKM
jgi:hypothetical protein